MGITQSLAEIIVAGRFEDMPEPLVAAARQAILDGIAVAIAGTTEDAVRIAAAHVKSQGGHPVATVWGFGFKTSPAAAAFVNGVATHVLDFEAMWTPPTHTTSPTLPVVFAIAEARQRGGRDIVTAFIKAAEVQGRLRLASGQYAPEEITFHPPGVVGVIGAAVAAGDMLGFDVMHMRYAIGLAASRAGSIIGNVGSMTKSNHSGVAASQGLDAALLVERGFNANPDILEAPKGFVEAFFGPTFDYDALMAYGHPWRLIDPGLTLKMFPTQFGTHWGINAALDARRGIADPAQIRAVRVRMPVMSYIDRPAPRNGLEGKFSIQYAVSAALLDGAVSISTYTDARRFSADMQDFLKKVTVEQVAEIPKELEKMHIELEVELANGEIVRTRCNGPKGLWGTTRITHEEHLVKVRDCLATRFDRAPAERCIAMLEQIERLDAAQVAELMALLATPQKD